MAIRNIIKEGDALLNKVCRPVEKFDDHLACLIDDMFDTLHEADGVGLAAPQVAVLRRVVVIDLGDGHPMELVNPTIIAKSGTQRDLEGCLSVPGVWGYTKRPMWVKVRAQDRHGEWHEYDGSALLARAFCHELDHLDGILFRKRVVEYVNADD